MTTKYDRSLFPRRRKQEASGVVASGGRPPRQRQPRGRSIRKGVGEDGRIHRGPMHFFKVQKPYCCPARSLIQKALHPYSIPIFHFEERKAGATLKEYAELWRIELRNFENLRYGGPLGAVYMASAIEAEFYVPQGQAGWAEDLIVASGRFVVIRGHIKGRGRDANWTQKHRMPQPWDADKSRAEARHKEFHGVKPGQAAIESDCGTRGNAHLWPEVIAIRNRVWKKQGRKRHD